MTYCTVVEFEWDEDFDHEGFRRALGRLSEESPSPAGLLSRITGIDASGARVIEVWRSGGDAQAFAEQSAPLLAAVRMPPPSRVTGFEVTSYEVT